VITVVRATDEQPCVTGGDVVSTGAAPDSQPDSGRKADQPGSDGAAGTADVPAAQDFNLYEALAAASYRPRRTFPDRLSGVLPPRQSRPGQQQGGQSQTGQSQTGQQQSGQPGPWGRRGRSANASPPGQPAPGSRPRTVVSARKALALLAAMALACGVLTWATVSMASAALKGGAGRPASGRLVNPAPLLAGLLPLRHGPVRQQSTRALIAEFSRRFDAATSGQAGVRPHGLYGEPGHVDAVTGGTAWIMYLGLDAAHLVGTPAVTVSHLMTGLLGPFKSGSPSPVVPGARGGQAQCTVAVMDLTQVAICGWAAGRTTGALMSPIRDTSVGELAMLMRAMRLNLEHRGHRAALSTTPPDQRRSLITTPPGQAAAELNLRPTSRGACAAPARAEPVSGSRSPARPRP
jgi:hypothetical protein